MYTATTPALGGLERIAQEQLQRAWQRTREDFRHEERTAAATKLGNAPTWLLPELLAIVEEFHDRPVVEIAPLIRRVLVDQAFVDENGDSIPDGLDPQGVRQRVDLLVQVLERVRCRALEEGQWSTAPVTPLMCG